MFRFFVLCCGLILMASCVTNRLQSHSASLNPEKTAQLQLQLGLYYLQQEVRARAYEKLRRAESLSPNNPDVLAALAYYFETLDDQAQAKVYYESSIRQAKDKGIYEGNYAMFLCHLGSFEEARLHFQLAFQTPKGRRSAKLYEHAGSCALAQGQVSMAMEYFEKAIQLDPQLIVAQTQLKKLLKDKKSMDNERKNMIQNQAS